MTSTTQRALPGCIADAVAQSLAVLDALDGSCSQGRRQFFFT